MFIVTEVKYDPDCYVCGMKCKQVHHIRSQKQLYTLCEICAPFAFSDVQSGQCALCRAYTSTQQLSKFENETYCEICEPIAFYNWQKVKEAKAHEEDKQETAKILKDAERSFGEDPEILKLLKENPFK